LTGTSILEDSIIYQPPPPRTTSKRFDGAVPYPSQAISSDAVAGWGEGKGGVAIGEVREEGQEGHAKTDIVHPSNRLGQSHVDESSLLPHNESSILPPPPLPKFAAIDINASVIEADLASACVVRLPAAAPKAEVMSASVIEADIAAAACVATLPTAAQLRVQNSVESEGGITPRKRCAENGAETFAPEAPAQDASKTHIQHSLLPVPITPPEFCFQMSTATDTETQGDLEPDAAIRTGGCVLGFSGSSSRESGRNANMMVLVPKLWAKGCTPTGMNGEGVDETNAQQLNSPHGWRSMSGDTGLEMTNNNLSYATPVPCAEDLKYGLSPAWQQAAAPASDATEYIDGVAVPRRRQVLHSPILVSPPPIPEREQQADAPLAVTDAARTSPPFDHGASPAKPQSSARAPTQASSASTVSASSASNSPPASPQPSKQTLRELLSECAPNTVQRVHDEQMQLQHSRDQPSMPDQQHQQHYHHHHHQYYQQQPQQHHQNQQQHQNQRIESAVQQRIQNQAKDCQQGVRKSVWSSLIPKPRLGWFKSKDKDKGKA
jgi:hypothetical protein